jgi:hypothetical protein
MDPPKKRYQDPSRKDWILGIAWLLGYLLVSGFGALFLVPENWIWWLLLFIASTVVLVFRQNRNYACRCRACGHEFEVSFLVNLLSPHGIDKEGSWMWVKCPQCKTRAKVSVIKVLKGA